MSMLCRALTLTSWVFLLHGCVTIAGAHSGVPLDGANQPIPATSDTQQHSLQISADELTYEASPYLGVVEVTFENATSAWQKIDEISIDFGTPERNRRVLVPWGANLSAWADAISVGLAVGLQNSAGELRTGLFGAVLRQRDRYAMSGDDVHEAGGLLPVDALEPLGGTAKAAPTADPAVTAPPPRRRFPDNHLLTLPIRVPPGLFAKRWIVLYTAPSPGTCIDHVVLTYHLSDQTRGKVLLPFKESSAWQMNSCWAFVAKVVGR